MAARKNRTPAQIINHLRRAEVELAAGRTVREVCKELGVRERRACRVLGQARSTQRRSPKGRPDEAALRHDVVRLAERFGRYVYRMVTGMLRSGGWRVNHKRVERIWRQEGLKVPRRQPKRARLWLNHGSCLRLRPLYRHHVWSYDFVADRTHDGRPLRMLTVLDEYSRECLAIEVARRLTATAVRRWLGSLGVRTLYITPGSPWENGYNERFNGTLVEEVLKREIFFTLMEARVLIEQWRREYNTVRPHSALGYRPPAPEARWPGQGTMAWTRRFPVAEVRSEATVLPVAQAASGRETHPPRRAL
jgi:putative transposase